MQRFLPANWANCRILPFRMTTSQKVIISVTASVALLSVLARYLRRRKPPRAQRRPRKYNGRRTRNSMRSPNDMTSIAGSKTSARSCSPIPSIVGQSDRFSLASGSTGAGVLASRVVSSSGTAGVRLTAQQLGVMGMEALDTVINYWEDALSSHYSPGGVPPILAATTAEDSEFCREIQNLLDMAYTLQDQSELLFLDQRSILFREEASVNEADEETEPAVNVDVEECSSRTSMNRTASDPNFDSAESFASALDQIADLREFEEFTDTLAEYDQYPLFQLAVKYGEEFTIPCRTVRTELVHCANDVEYLAKLYSIRLAFQHLFKDNNFGQWIVDTGRQVLTDLLCLGDRDSKEFLVGYEDMINYLQDPNNWEHIQAELEIRNVKVMTFYDICLDFIVLDSFRDLDAPPTSVTAVVQNRFLSNGFKETALTTAVWSVLKAKKRMLKNPNGFMAHFYVISEQLSPLMAWGFFGPDEHLRGICHYFRDQILEFLVDIFSFQKSRYTTIEELAEDVLQHMKTRVNNISVKFSQ